MGKTNKAQRTKGNTRPSSSARMPPEALGRPFLGFSSGEATPGFVPVTGIVEDCSLDADFRMVLRKMLKRDPLTRIKAVQEFGDYCLEKEEETVKSVLPFWPRLYNKLVLDCERRVREGAHLCQGALGKRAGRAMAPHLRPLLAPWLLGQGDPHPTARENARRAFEETFATQERRSEALLFCKEEIVEYFKSNLMDPLAKVKLDSNCCREELDDQCVLLLSASLQALRVFLEGLLPGAHIKVEKDFQQILERGKFWTYAHHQEAQVRSCWFGLLSCLCHLLPGAFTRKEKLQSLVPRCFSERDPCAMAATWEALLHILQHMEVNLEENLTGPLWALLKFGDLGPSLLPCLLPLLSKFPSRLTSSREFLEQLFCCLADSLHVEKVKMSRLHSEAVLVAYVECLQHFCCTVHGGTELGRSLLVEALDKQIVPLVKASFYETEYVHLASLKFYPLLRSLLQKMECPGPVELFWNRMWDITSNLSSSTPQCHSRVRQFFRCIFTPSELAEKPRVRFRDPPEMNSTSPENPPEPFDEDILATLELSLLYSLPKDSPSYNYVMNMTELLRKKLDSQFDVHTLKLLSELFVSALDRDAFRDFGVLGNGNGTEFLNEMLLKWLPAVGDEADMDCIIDIVFKMCTCVSAEEASMLINRCFEVEDLRFLVRLLNRPQVRHPNFAAWISTSRWLDNILSGLGATFLSIASQRDCSQVLRLAAYQNLLKLCCGEPQLKRCLIAHGLPGELLCLLRDLLGRVDRETEWEPVLLETCHLLDTLLENELVDWNDSTLHSVLSTLFRLNLHSVSVNGKVSRAILVVWNSAVHTCTGEHFGEGGFMENAASDLHSALMSPSGPERREHVSRLSVNLFTECPPSLRGQLSRVVFPSEQDWAALRKGLAMTSLSALLENKLFYPIPLCKDEPSAGEDGVWRLLLSAEAVASILSVDRVICEEEGILKQMPHLLWSLSFCSPNGLIEPVLLKSLKVEHLTHGCRHLLSRLPQQKLQLLLSDLLERCMMEELPWSLTLAATLELISEPNVEEIFSQIERPESAPIAVQVLLPHLPLQRKHALLKSWLGKINEKISPRSTSVMACVCCLLQDPAVLASEEIRSLLADLAPLLTWCSEDVLLCLQDACLLSAVVQCVAHSLIEEGWKGALHTLALTMKCCLDHSPTPLVSLHLCTSLLGSLGQYLSWRKDCNADFALFAKISLPSLPVQTYRQAVELFLHITGPNAAIPDSPCFARARSRFVETLAGVPAEVLEGEQGDGLVSGLLDSLPTDEPGLQLAVCRMLSKWISLLPKTLECDAKDEESEEGGRKWPDRLLPLLDLIECSGKVVADCLREARVGDLCQVPSDAEEHHIVLAHLLAWELVLEFIPACSARFRSGYIEHLEESELLSSFFANVFRLLPQNPNACLGDATDSLHALFFRPPPLSKGDVLLPRVSCWVFCSALRRVPASLRTWYNNLDKMARQAVQSFTSKYVSDLLCAEEIQAVQDNKTQFDNMMVRARSGVHDVLASYSVDGSSLELCVRLPPDFPLGAVSAERRGPPALVRQEWTTWLRQLVTLLNYRNGSIVDGLCLWKHNLDRKFEGVEECMICYYVLHSSSLRLPKLSCRVCRKKFHSQCLYKWFHTSNNSTCPLCRNEFGM